MTVYIIPPPEKLHRVWLRLMVATALNVICRRAGKFKVSTVLQLSEFPSCGNMSIIKTAMAESAKFGLRIWPIAQDFNQFVELYKREGAMSFVANNGCMIAFAPNDHDTAEMLSKHTGDHWVEMTSTSENIYGEINANKSWQRQRIWPPERIQSLPKFHALVWFYGNPVPQQVYCKPYFLDPACLAVARDDPYPHPGASDKPRRSWFGRQGR